MGVPKTFRGTYGDLTEDNRANISINEAGDKVFVTWIDTRNGGVDNIEPDVFARGFDLLTNKITHNINNNDDCDNVTFLSDITGEAYFMCASHYVFTEGNDCIIPMVTELLSDPADPAQPVTFKYISDFAYTAPDDYTISTGNGGFPVGIDKKDQNLASVAVYPNPVRDNAKLSVNLVQAGNVSVEVSNTVGQVVISQNFGKMNAGTSQVTLDASSLNAGIYFCSVIVNGGKYTTKMIVE
jgi:hypothetical protein